ncbi:MAG: type II secretion system F family protein [Deltaproteobacteria bacterium HGW-Deltaproteobacteria-1]|jgi:type IV pilus assembly protein PilC|nr:MAG: type II secretion system F family protein [Deltaproteobacteria bacterium HGW-Deltaproteobacteria-1]
MATYRYNAIDETGNSLSGTLDAESMQNANAMLGARGLIPTEISEDKGGSGESLMNKINAMTGGVKIRDLILFTKQFRSMLNAGVPIIRVLQVLEAQTESDVLRRAVTDILAEVRQGSTLSDAFAKHPRIFSNLYCSMVRAGEMSGSVPSVLERLIYIIEHEAKIKADIKSALQYPIMVLIALGIAFFVLLTFVIPQFTAMFSKTGLELPLPTKIAILMNVYLKNYWYVMLGGLFAVIFGLRQYFKTQNGKLVRDSFLLSIPVLGPLMQKAAMSRFSSIFAILQSSGVSVMQSLTILSDTIGNAAIANSFDHIKSRIEEGSGIAAPMKTAKYFPPMVIDMIAIGEESGNIEEMLREISKHYDEEVEYAVKALSEAIGPILIVGLAAVIGFFALAIYMPMWDLTKMVKK